MLIHPKSISQVKENGKETFVVKLLAVEICSRDIEREKSVSNYNHLIFEF